MKIVHDWKNGPRWPLPGFYRRWIANAIIGPVFIHHVASRHPRRHPARDERG
ncbi:MAG TPA: hypothetical protein VEQ60_05510 [Longimicrobium sp.]|nr:hypothetical protein [Longimicrobium sp.]